MNRTNLIEDWTLLPPPPWWQDPRIWLGAVLALGLAWWVRRWWQGRQRHPVPVPRPAPPSSPALHNAFLARLAALRTRRAQLSAYQLAIEVSEILRGYLEARFQFPVLFQTTREFLEAAAGSPHLKPAQQARLEAFLRACDAVKFARRPATPEEQEDLLDAAEAFIRQAAGLEPAPPA